MGCCSDVGLHAKRILMWRLNEVIPTSREQKLMSHANVPETTPVFRSFLAWRHTNLLVALPVTLFSAMWSIWGYVEAWQSSEDMAYLNGFGVFLWSLPYFNAPILFGAVVISCYYWSNWRFTRSLLKAGWGLSFFLPFLPALFPIELLINSETYDYYNSSEAAYAELIAIKLQLALEYVLVILPLIITFPSGAVRAAVRIRGLLPQSSLTSWVLVLSAPFYSLLILTGFVVLLQLLGDPLLLTGVALLALSPWIYVMMRHHYIRPAETLVEEQRLDHIQQSTGIVNLIGIALALAWAITSGIVGTSDEETGGYISYADIVRIVFTGFANGLITCIIFADAFLRMTVTNWKMDKKRRDMDAAILLQESLKQAQLPEKEEHDEKHHDEGEGEKGKERPPFVSIDELFAVIEGTIRKPSYQQQQQQEQPPAQATGEASESQALSPSSSAPAAVAVVVAAPASNRELVDDAHMTAASKSSIPSSSQQTRAVPEAVPKVEAAGTPVETASSSNIDTPPPDDFTTEDAIRPSSTFNEQAATTSIKPKKSKSKKLKEPTTLEAPAATEEESVPQVPDAVALVDPTMNTAAAASSSKPKKAPKKSKEAKKEKKKKKESSKISSSTAVLREEPSESNVSESEAFEQE